MTIASAHNLPLDPYLAWQALNGAAHCHRLSAKITKNQCEINSQSARSFGDWGGCECSSACHGLQDQNLSVKPAKAPPVLLWDNGSNEMPPETEDCTIVAPAIACPPDDEIDGLAALDEIIDRLYDDPAPNDDFTDIELDLDDEQLLALFPELAKDKDDDNLQDFQRFTEYQEAAPRYAIYRGRCKRCGGYVANTRERHDDNVFRCLECGWRTGIEYERNRSICAVGGVVI